MTAVRRTLGRQPKSPAWGGMHSRAGIRPLAAGDIPAVAQLFSRVYPQNRWGSQSACEAYFQEIFFANPWVAAQLPSWVAMEGARAVGFISVMPRPMRLRGSPLALGNRCQGGVPLGPELSIPKGDHRRPARDSTPLSHKHALDDPRNQGAYFRMLGRSERRVGTRHP